MCWRIEVHSDSDSLLEYRRVEGGIRAWAAKPGEYFNAFDGIEGEITGDFGYSGNGAAGFELHHIDARLGTPDNAVLLARSVTGEDGIVLMREEQLTHLANPTGGPEAEARHVNMVHADYPGGGSVFATGSITLCGSLPWKGYDNNISKLLKNVLRKKLA